MCQTRVPAIFDVVFEPRLSIIVDHCRPVDFCRPVDLSTGLACVDLHHDLHLIEVRLAVEERGEADSVFLLEVGCVWTPVLPCRKRGRCSATPAAFHHERRPNYRYM